MYSSVLPGLHPGALEDGIHLGGVDEIHATILDGVVELLVRLSLGVLHAPRHGPKAHLRHHDIGISSFTLGRTADAIALARRERTIGRRQEGLARERDALRKNADWMRDVAVCISK